MTSSNLTFDEIITGERFQALADVTFVTFSHSQVHTSCSKVNRIFYEQLFGVAEIPLSEMTSVFIYASNQQLFKSLVLPLIKVKIILLVHNGDDEFSDWELVNSDKIAHILAQNCPIEHEKITHVPIGIANAMWPHGNLQEFWKCLQTGSETKKTNKLYANFGASTYPSLRLPLLEKIKSKDDNIVLETGKTFSEYLTKMKTCDVVLSPRGNGLDSHRLWEALYLGCKVLCDKNPLSLILKKLELDIYLFEDLNFESAWNEATNDISDNNPNPINRWLLLSTYRQIIDNLQFNSQPKIKMETKPDTH